MNPRRTHSLPLLLLCASCAPSIYTFHAAPRRICRGDSVTLDWNASKAGTISALPAQPTPGEVPAQGTASVVPTSSARFHLEVSNLWGSAARDNDVEVLAGRSLPVGQSVADPSATCADSTLAVTAQVPADAWSAQAVVGAVTTLGEDKHRYHIEHAGLKVDLSPGEVTQAFKGTKVAGAWALSLTLLDGEKCGTQSVPHNLGVQLVAACSIGAP
ncbi:MAG TPA: hypothetical protein VER04_07820 [Polyangiaceae bacterium]|nr:hypothetical protein [Polyangiaceae bacterium]